MTQQTSASSLEGEKKKKKRKEEGLNRSSVW